MSFLALPSSTVLVCGVIGLHLFKADRANKDPLLRIVKSNPVKYIVDLLTPITGLGAYAFDWHMSVAIPVV